MAQAGVPDVAAIRDWVKDYVETAIQGGGINAYPVGSIYMSLSATSPADIFGGTWEALDDGRVLIGANAAHPVGETGGAEKVTLTTGQIPAHNHSMGSAGSHSHSGTATSAGSHTHSRGTMNIVGKATNANDTGLINTDYSGITSGAFEKGTSYSRVPNTVAGNSKALNFDASNDWTGSTSSDGSHSHGLDIDSAGNHTHTINNAGGGGEHENMPPYLSVYMWKRTA